MTDSTPSKELSMNIIETLVDSITLTIENITIKLLKRYNIDTEDESKIVDNCLVTIIEQYPYNIYEWEIYGKIIYRAKIRISYEALKISFLCTEEDLDTEFTASETGELQ